MALARAAGIGRFEDAGTDEDGLGAKLHHQGRVGRSGNPAGGKIRYRKLAMFGHPFDQFQRRLQFLGLVHQLFLAQHGELLHFLNDGADVAHRLDDVAGAGFALGADHGGAFGDTAQRFAQVARAANERHLEIGSYRCGSLRRPG